MNEDAAAPARSLTAGGRQRFQVELRPGETTIVSWKKLVKDANRAAKEANKSSKGKSPAPEMTSVAEADSDSRVAPGELPQDDAKDAPPSRFSAVIEKIERLYKGKNSSDEEDLNDVPDDDEYDTDDSFIDDVELDEYFQVDNSAIKHDGFFVNRGKLERINEPTTSSPHQQQKKRRRKDLVEGPGESNEGDAQNKHSKVRKKAAGKPLTLPEKDFSNPTLVMALPSVNCEDMIVKNQSNSSEIIEKNGPANVKKALHQSPSRVSNGEAIAEEKGDKLKAGVLPAKNHGSKSKDGNELSDTLNQMLNKRSSGSGEDKGQSAQQGKKIKIGEQPGNIVSEGRNPVQAMKVPRVQRKEGSSSKSKTTLLEKAIRDLETMVAESRPPSTEASDADILNHTSKRRMPPEMKPKLAKIARLAQSTHGVISRELLNRLMSIVGHMIQLRTLKRNLKILGEMGLSAKQEINTRFKQIKKEIDDMVKVRVPLMKSKAIEQPGGTSDDFQETGTADNEVLKRKFSMDDALEDKICDLYDLYVQGMEEDSGPAHRLYAELAELWPKGCMDNHGIKRAICRAKDRKKAVHGLYKNQEKMKRKKPVSNKEKRVVEINSVTLSHVQDKMVTEPGAASVDKSVSGVIAADAATTPTVVVNGANMDLPKQEKLKGNSIDSNDMKITELLVKKKSKRKPESELGGALARSDKLHSEHGDERNKSVKQSAGSSPKTNLQPAAPAPAPAPTSENM